jgi:hypothetical protein
MEKESRQRAETGSQQAETPGANSEWNFDKVPDGELVACCYWEYARESAFIRSVRDRCLQNHRAGDPCDQRLHADVQTIQSIGYPSEVFIRGFFFEPYVAYQCEHEKLPNYRHPDAPPITGSFPKAWQELPMMGRAWPLIRE